MERLLTSTEQDFAITTWRYLRLAMVALVLGLGVALAYERSRWNCFQTSISAYYYTPVHGYFIGGLVAIGVCLFCLKGNSRLEDILLNLAGICAPIVALVPMSDPGACHPILNTKDRDVNIANNVRALLAVELLGLLFIAYLNRHRRPTRKELIGYGAGAVIWVVTTLAFYVARDFFVSKAHFTGAGLMFALMIGVVGLNALDYKKHPSPRWRHNPYPPIAGAMLASLVLIPIGLFSDWPYWVIWLESILISLFALFWAIQTRELWGEGLRPNAQSR